MSNELAQQVEALRREEEVIRQGGGAKAVERQHGKNRLTARERIARLIDPGADFFELGLWAAWNMYRDWGGASSAGVVTGVGTVAGRTVMVIANDATVKAGAFFPMTCKKVLRAQRIALENRLPLVYLVDCAGVFLPLQDEVFPDEDDFGRIFRNNAVISAAGVPQFAAILGNCVAGGGYLPVLCDKLLMTEGSGLYLAGPALVKAAIGQTVSHEDLGGAAMHAAISGTIDFREPNDEACLERLRRLVGLLPEPAARGASGLPGRPPADLLQLYPSEARQEYDIRDLLPCILDAGPFDEYKAEYGQTLVCGYGRLGGLPVGVVANQRKRCRAGGGAVAVRRRPLRGQRRQGGPVHHGLQPDARAAVVLAGRERLHGRPRFGARGHHQGAGPSWSTSSPTASCRRSRSSSAARSAPATTPCAARRSTRGSSSPGRRPATP